MFNRRDLLIKGAAAMLSATPVSTWCASFDDPTGEVPRYLAHYKQQYGSDPRQAAFDWFRHAKFGLFMHYGLYSLLGKGEWVQFNQKIPVREYEKLKDRHHDGFCLFKTSTTSFNSYDSPAKRDLVGELANACAKKGLGLCLYYSHGRDWRDPDAPNNDQWGGNARPQYSTPEPTYHTGNAHDLNRYIDHINTHMRELLTNYGPIASIWFDGYDVPASGDVSKFRLPETYALIRSLQKQCLIAYKAGPTSLEDYYAPEMGWVKSRPEKTEEMLHSGKPREICASMSPGWGYHKSDDGKHFSESVIWSDLELTASLEANLLLNTGLRPDGSIDSQDIHTLRQIGHRIRAHGLPPTPKIIR